MSRLSEIYPPQHKRVGSIRSHHHYPAVGLAQRQNIVSVLQQHHLFSCHSKCELFMLLRGNDRLRYLCPFHERIVVEIAKFETRLEQSAHTYIHLFFLDFPCSHGLRQTFVVATAFHVGPARHSFCRSRSSISRNTVSAFHPEV